MTTVLHARAVVREADGRRRLVVTKLDRGRLRTAQNRIHGGYDDTKRRYSFGNIANIVLSKKTNSNRLQKRLIYDLSENSLDTNVQNDR